MFQLFSTAGVFVGGVQLLTPNTHKQCAAGSEHVSDVTGLSVSVLFFSVGVDKF